LCDGGQRDLELCATGAAKAQSAKPQNALEVREQHLDLLAIAARLRERLRFGEGTSDIACGLVHIADDPSRWHVRAALRFERAGATLRHGGKKKDLEAQRCIEALSRYDPVRSKPDKTIQRRGARQST
jgi:hypothetical protein